MSVWILLAGALALAAAGFVLAPLFRAEEDLEPLVRPRSGIRKLAGPESPTQTAASRDVAPTDGTRRCPHCDTEIDGEYAFCGACANPLAN